MTKTEAMAAFGIMSMSPLKKWCALYRRGGAEALRPRPKGRPSGSRARPRTREEELEERCRGLEAEVAYLNYAPWSRGTGSDQGEGRSARGPARRGARARHLLACAELKRSTYYYALAHPPRPTRAELRRRPPRSSRAPPTAAGTGR
ncbi:MAG: helix-turn-helix domain-containing protein [Collinsella aerofaciens]